MTKSRNIARRLTIAQREEAVQRFVSGESLAALAAEYQVNRSSIRRLARSRGHADFKGTNRRHGVNEKAFDTLTPESAYWLGFLMGDGCVGSGRRGFVKLTLAVRDQAHVEKFRAFVGSSHPIRVAEHVAIGGNISTTAELIVFSTRLAAALASWGMKGLKPTRKIDPSLQDNRHFWRGLIDADGSLGEHKIGKYFYPRLRLAGQENVIAGIREFAKQFFPVVTKASVDKRTGLRDMLFHGQHSLILLRALYTDAPIALCRKHEKALMLLEKHEGQKSRRYKCDRDSTTQE